jgi:hypothetical protein
MTQRLPDPTVSSLSHRPAAISSSVKLSEPVTFSAKKLPSVARSGPVANVIVTLSAPGALKLAQGW